MKHPLRSAVTTTGRRMAGARSLWRANGMREEQFGRPVIGIANSFTQLVPGHVHLHEIGQYVKQRIEALGCFAAEFNTIAIDDGIAMGHDGMLYSLPSREIIADSVEYMANAHRVDALVCISNCDKITPGMLMAAMRLDIPTVFVSGGPMEAGHLGEQRSQTALPERPGRPLQPGTGHTTDLLRHTGHRPHGRLHPRSGTRLFPRRRAGRTDGQHRPPGLHRQDGRRRRVAVCLPRARPRLRIAGAGHRRHPRRRGAGRRRRCHTL